MVTFYRHGLLSVSASEHCVSFSPLSKHVLKTLVGFFFSSSWFGGSKHLVLVVTGYLHVEKLPASSSIIRARDLKSVTSTALSF